MIQAGQRFDFKPNEIWGAQDDLRPVDRAVARWVIAHGGSPGLARLAAQASLADGRGDSALRIDEDVLRGVLTDSEWVGNAASNSQPFVIDGDLFYLRRNFLNEVAVATMLHQRLRSFDVEDETLDLHGLFDEAGGNAQAGQVEAVRKALDRRLFVLTGGPGTGKTTTVLRLLMAASRNHRSHHDEWPRILLAAPTGKAAQRLGESLRNATPEDFPTDWQDALLHVQSGATGTLHRLLGSRGTRGGFSRDSENPLDADIVVVDEASMLDLALLRALLSALRPQTRLVLVGDADQLDSVGTGSVLQDIVVALDGEAGQHLQRLRHAYRADAALRPLNEAVRIGDAIAFDAGLNSASAQALHRPVGTVSELTAQLDAWSDAILLDYRAHRIDKPVNEAEPDHIPQLLAAAGQRQLLCALREGPFGAAGLNAAIETRLSPALQSESGTSPGARWYPGRRILITRNDAASGLFNGDIGLCLLDTEGRLRAWFQGGDVKPRSFDVGSLPPHEPAFAMTVHKAQGSEYDEVAVLLPPQAEHPLLSRQWFYTAISRARRALHLWGSDAAVRHAIDHPARRSSGLSRRIRTAISP